MTSGEFFVLYKMVREHKPIKVICDVLNISTSTYYSWIRKGKEVLDKKEFTDKEKDCKKFYKIVSMAREKNKRGQG